MHSVFDSTSIHQSFSSVGFAFYYTSTQKQGTITLLYLLRTDFCVSFPPWHASQLTVFKKLILPEGPRLSIWVAKGAGLELLTSN